MLRFVVGFVARAVVCGTLMSGLFGCTAAMAAPEPWRVVLLTGADPTQPAVAVLDRSFRRALQAAAPNGVEFFADNVDSVRFKAADLTPELLALLRKKYEHQKIDLVVGMTEYALDLIVPHQAELWPQARVLVYGIDEASLQDGRLPERFTYLPWRLDIDGTLAMAEALQPQARRLVVVSGMAAFDVELAARVADAARSRPRGRWTVEVWSGLTMDELRGRLGALERDTAVLYTSMHRDRLGHAHFPFGALAAMTEVSRAPIYGMYSTYMDAGLAGGVLVDFDAVGERAGATAAGILSGQASTTQTALPASRCVADAPRLKAFGLDARALPAGCALARVTPSAWQEYRGEVLAAGAVLMLQAVTIASLLWQRRRRREAEAQLIEHGVELARATRFAAMGELSASIAHEIRQPLGAILSNTEAAEMMLDAGNPDLQQLREILGDIRRDDLRAHEVIRRLRVLLQKQQTEHAPLDLHDTLDEALKLLASEMARCEVRVERDFAAADDHLMADRIQIQQVLVNLVRNALDAMEGLGAESRVVGVATADVHGGIELRVSDPGRGIAPEHRQRLFEPFFTTKARGMGMGLSIVRSIVEVHGGTVRADARKGQGTVFTVWLPRSADAGEATAAPPAAPPIRAAA